MSVREEDKKKSGCPSRGLGLAAAAIGVGIGAALYYIFSKEEHPDTEGATSSQWNTESPQPLQEDHNSSNDYTTISVNTTTDISMNEDSDHDSDHNSPSSDHEDVINIDDSVVTIDDSVMSIDDSAMSIGSDPSTSPSRTPNDDTPSSRTSNVDSPSSSASLSDFSIPSHNDNSFPRWSPDHEVSDFMSELSPPSSLEDSVFSMIWSLENNNMSYDLPRLEPSQPMRRLIHRFVSPSPTRSRERSWSLEECSICFEVILKNQEVMSLPCTHHFHQSCILPWLQEHQTCPNCRKAVD